MGSAQPDVNRSRRPRGGPKITRIPRDSGTAGSKAEELALRQREISVSEFFTKNRHLLGFDNPTRALLTAVKEAVDNSLDACEEAGILPEIRVRIRQKSEDRFEITIEDNGPGIVEEQIPNIFGKLLYGSKFHTLKMARGQQGIGISAVCLYGQLTTGKPMEITSRIAKNKPPHHFEVMIDTSRNQPISRKIEDGVTFPYDHGTRIRTLIEGRYVKGDKSVDEYLKQTSLANPHVNLIYHPPVGDRVVYPRVSRTLPRPPKEIRPHPYGVELGTLIKMLQSSRAKDLRGCLKNGFSRVTDRIASEILENSNLDGTLKPMEMSSEQFEALYRGIQKTKIMAPPTDCLSPIGEDQLRKALEANVKAEFYCALTRPPAVYRGNPFQIEVGLAYGVEGRTPEQGALVSRLANRVPLLYQPGACALTKAIQTVDWRAYGIPQPRAGLPEAPLLLIVHIASVWVPFTSEAKEAVAHYPEILKEVKLALQETGRRASVYVRRKARSEAQRRRRSLFERYIEEVSTSLHGLTGCGRERLRGKLLKLARSFTDQLDRQEEERE